MSTTRLAWGGVLDPTYSSDRERYAEYNFHDPEELQRLIEFIVSPNLSKTVQLGGPDRVGRKYLLEAAACHAGRQGTRALVAHVDLSKYETDSPAIQPFVDYLLEKYGRDREAVLRYVLDAVRVTPKLKLSLLSASDAVSLSLSAVLKLPLDIVKRLFAPVAAQPRSARDRLALLLEHLTQDRILILQCPFDHCDEQLLAMLVSSVTASPNLRLALTHEPERRDIKLPDAPDVEYFELKHLDRRGLRQAVDRCLQPNRFPDEFYDVLYSSTNGRRDVLALRLLDLPKRRLIEWTDSDGWRLANAEAFSSSLPGDFEAGILDGIEQLRDHLASDSYSRLLHFLRLGALCGESIPATYLFRFMKLDEQQQAELDGLIRSELIELAHALRAWWTEGPDFPGSVTYTFQNPAVREVILKHFNANEKKQAAANLLTFIEDEIGVRTRAIARICLRLTAPDVLFDVTKSRAYQHKLSWWISVDEAEEFIARRVAEMEAGRLDPQQLWSMCKDNPTWMPHRRLMLLQAYERQPGVMGLAATAGILQRNRRVLYGRWDARQRELLPPGGSARPQDTGTETTTRLRSTWLRASRQVWLRTGQARRCREAPSRHARSVESASSARITPDTLRSMNDLAAIQFQRGRLPDAAKLCRAAMEHRKRILGEAHSDTLRSMDDLATAWLEQGKIADAETLSREATERRTRILGEDHPNTLTSMRQPRSRLAPNRASSSTPRSCTATRSNAAGRILGEDHPNTLTSMNNLAVRLARTGQAHRRREALHCDTLERRKRILGEDHPDTLTSMNHLAAVWFANRASSPTPRSCTATRSNVRKRILGEDHSDTLTSMNNLAGVFFRQGRLNNAGELRREVVKHSKRILGEAHPDTLRSMNDLAAVWFRQGKLVNTEKLLRVTLDRRERILGEDHPDTLTSMNNLAAVWREQGKLIDAEKLYCNALERRKASSSAKIIPTRSSRRADVALVWFRTGQAHRRREATQQSAPTQEVCTRRRSSRRTQVEERPRSRPVPTA